jgi:hypothetical protein
MPLCRLAAVMGGWCLVVWKLKNGKSSRDEFRDGLIRWSRKTKSAT